MTLDETARMWASALLACLLATTAAAQGSGDCPGPGCPGGQANAPLSTPRSLGLQVRINVPIAFPTGSPDLPEDEKPLLIDICKVIQDRGSEIMDIIGHTDASGASDYNQRLSEARAESVKAFFVNECGLPADLLEAVGAGENQPLDPDDPYSPVNRRIEVRTGS